MILSHALLLMRRCCHLSRDACWVPASRIEASGAAPSSSLVYLSATPMRFASQHVSRRCPTSRPQVVLRGAFLPVQRIREPIHHGCSTTIHYLSLQRGCWQEGSRCEYLPALVSNLPFFSNLLIIKYLPHSEVAGGEDVTAGSFASFGVRRYAPTSLITMRIISATGMASNAPGMPSSCPPTSSAMRITSPFSCTAWL